MRILILGFGILRLVNLVMACSCITPLTPIRMWRLDSITNAPENLVVTSVSRVGHVNVGTQNQFDLLSNLDTDSPISKKRSQT